MHTIKPQYRVFFKDVDVNKYRKFVLWGLHSEIDNTFRYIMRHYYETMTAIGLDVVWVDDEADNIGVIQPDTLVIAANMSAQHLPIIDGAYYCLHNFHIIKTDYHTLISPSHNIRLQVYTDEATDAKQKWNDVTYFEPSTRTLYQSWGTNILPDRFRRPIYSRLPIVFWVGSIWNDAENHGNLNEIAEFREVLKEHKLIFKQLIGVSDRINMAAIRHSRIAPAIAGGWQVENNLLPCRMFKNISYGQLGFSNVQKFNEILGDATIYNQSIAKSIAQVLELKPSAYKELITRQQQIISADHTYVSKIANILRAFEEVKGL